MVLPIDFLISNQSSCTHGVEKKKKNRIKFLANKSISSRVCVITILVTQCNGSLW